MLTRADLNKTSPVCLFPTPKETITEIKIRIGGGREIEIFGSGGPTKGIFTVALKLCLQPSTSLASLRSPNPLESGLDDTTRGGTGLSNFQTRCHLVGV